MIKTLRQQMCSYYFFFLTDSRLQYFLIQPTTIFLYYYWEYCKTYERQYKPSQQLMQGLMCPEQQFSSWSDYSIDNSDILWTFCVNNSFFFIFLSISRSGAAKLCRCTRGVHMRHCKVTVKNNFLRKWKSLQASLISLRACMQYAVAEGSCWVVRIHQNSSCSLHQPTIMWWHHELSHNQGCC